MTDQADDGETETFDVLHVDDDAGVRDLVASFLPLERPALTVRSSASTASSRTTRCPRWTA
jgi:CheY-like chemotaxis protein